jgi:4-hydroxymandelate oxidase
MDRRHALQSMASMAGALSAAVATGEVAGKAAAQSPPRPSPLAQQTTPPIPETELPVNVLEYEAAAQKRISQMAYDYVAGGAGDEITLRANRSSFDKIRLMPRALVDVSKLDTKLQLLGQEFEFPIILAPTAYHKLVHPQGELATAAGAQAANVTYTVSTFATTSIEKIAASTKGRLWFQLYVQPDRAFTKDLIQKAEGLGVKALVITVDTPVLGVRDREKRSRFNLPPGLERENLIGLGSPAARQHSPTESAIFSAALDPTLTWDVVQWIQSFAKVPVILKGIINPADARRAVQQGAHGILVSNHGARNLDTGPATIDALPHVLEAVEGKIPVLMDGGVRRGTDIVKALALGANAVLIGRPYLWALGLQGADGVKRVVDMLRTELAAAMALCGTTSLKEIDKKVLWPYE